MRRRELTNHRKSTLYNSLGRPESEQKQRGRAMGGVRGIQISFFTDQGAPDYRYRCILIVYPWDLSSCTIWSWTIPPLFQRQRWSSIHLDLKMWQMMTVAAPPGSSVFSNTPPRCSNMGRFTKTSNQAAGWCDREVFSGYKEGHN